MFRVLAAKTVSPGPTRSKEKRPQWPLVGIVTFSITVHEKQELNVSPESVTVRVFSSGNSRGTWPDVAKIDSAADFLQS